MSLEHFTNNPIDTLFKNESKDNILVIEVGDKEKNFVLQSTWI
jgi:hypothetical protein